MTDTTTIPPPAGLSEPARALWASVLHEYELEDHHRAIFEQALRAYERAEQARAVLDAEGLTITTANGSVKTHPAAAIERDSRIAFARLMRQLDLEGEPGPAPSRPRPLERRDDAAP